MKKWRLLALCLAAWALLTACNPAEQFPRRVPPSVDGAHPFVTRTLGGMVVGGAASSGKTIALTFDDGPSTYTPQVLSVLAGRHVPATFFLVGRNIAGREDTVRQTLSFGNRIGIHGWTHTDLTTLSSTDMARELDWSVDALRQLSPDDPARCVRPPYGGTNSRVHDAIASRGLAEVHWSVDPTDYEQPSAQTIADRVVGAARDGYIVLMHDGGGPRGNTVAALPQIIDRLQAAGYTFVVIC